jgi:hypothetical protein
VLVSALAPERVLGVLDPVLLAVALDLRDAFVP